MPDFAMLLQLALPLLMFAGGIAAWRATRRSEAPPSPDKPQWRDDSLDDWRRQRDADAEAERLSRESSPPAAARLHEDATAAERAAEKRQTRLGG